ncbi:transposase [Aeromonas veronii]
MDYGRSQFYTDQIIVTFLMVKGIFNLTMRATQGLYCQRPVRADECATVHNGYSYVSRLARTVTVAYRQAALPSWLSTQPG